MPTAYGYVRVSSPGQHDSGLGEEAQRQAIQLCYAKQPGDPKARPLCETHPTFVAVEDVASATKLPMGKRPKGGQLLKDIKRGDVLIVSKIDRAFRNLAETFATVQMLTERGVRIICPDHPMGEVDFGSMHGRTFLMMYAWAAEMESMRKSQRQLDVVAVMEQQGRSAGQVPIGFKKVRYFRDAGRTTYKKPPAYLFPEVGERRIMQQIVAWRQAGTPMESIVSHLKRHGVKWRGLAVLRATLYEIIAMEDKLRKMEEQLPDLTKEFVTPKGVRISFDLFEGAVPKKELALARQWRQGESAAHAEKDATCTPTDGSSG